MAISEVIKVRRLEPGVDRNAFRSLLLRSTLLLAQQMANDFGCVGLVDAKPDAVAFYEKLGFLRLESVAGELGDRPVPVPMFLELAQFNAVE